MDRFLKFSQAVSLLLFSVASILIGASALIFMIDHVNKPPSYQERMEELVGESFLEGMRESTEDITE